MVDTSILFLWFINQRSHHCGGHHLGPNVGEMIHDGPSLGDQFWLIRGSYAIQQAAVPIKWTVQDPD